MTKREFLEELKEVLSEQLPKIRWRSMYRII